MRRLHQLLYKFEYLARFVGSGDLDLQKVTKLTRFLAYWLVCGTKKNRSFGLKISYDEVQFVFSLNASKILEILFNERVLSF